MQSWTNYCFQINTAFQHNVALKSDNVQYTYLKHWALNFIIFPYSLWIVWAQAEPQQQH